MRRSGLVGWAIAVCLVAVALYAPTVAAETFVSLWNEDFCDTSDWTVDLDWAIDNPSAPCSIGLYSFDGTWSGPTYRSATSSTWNPAEKSIVKVRLDNLIVNFTTPTDNQNRQFGVRIASDHSTIDTDGNNYMDFKLLRSPCCLASPQWEVLWRDDGGTIHDVAYPIGEIGELEVDANITVNTEITRYWINWTAGALGSSITGLYTNDADGPFAESTAFSFDVWGYNSHFSNRPSWRLGEMEILLAGVAAGAPTSEEPVVGEVHADFRWLDTVFGIQFYDRSVGPGKIVKWAWSFGDGYGSRRAGPLHQYPCAGRYTVTVSVVDEFGNTGKSSNLVVVNESTPTCGILQRAEEGLAVNTGHGWLTIPEAFFLGVLIFSAASLALRVDPQWGGRDILSRKARILLLGISLAFLLVQFGFLGQFT